MTSTAMMKVHQAKLISTGNGRAPDAVAFTSVFRSVYSSLNREEKRYADDEE
jgi:hypothetical protein